MGLNIKNERVVEKARRLAQQRKTSQTAVVEAGLDLLAAQGQQSAIDARIEEILQRLDAIAADEAPLTEVGLYDDEGLPR